MLVKSLAIISNHISVLISWSWSEWTYAPQPVNHDDNNHNNTSVLVKSNRTLATTTRSRAKKKLNKQQIPSLIQKSLSLNSTIYWIIAKKRKKHIELITCSEQFRKPRPNAQCTESHATCILWNSLIVTKK